MSDESNRIIRWTCDTCGWSRDIPMPGFAGSMLGGTHQHWRGDDACGPLTGELLLAEAHPGASLEEIAAVVQGAGY